MDLLLPAVDSLFYNASLVLVVYKCIVKDTSPPTAEVKEEEEDLFSDEDEEDEDIFASEPSGPSFFDNLRQLFGSSSTDSDPERDSELADSGTHSESECVTFVEISQEHSVNAGTLVHYTCVVLATCILGIILWLLVRCCVKYKNRKSEQKISNSKTLSENESREYSPESHITEVAANFDNVMNDLKPILDKKPMPLIGYKSLDKAQLVKVNRTDAKDFLSSTVDRFLRELDEGLGISSDHRQDQVLSLNPNLNPSSSSGAISSLASPRVRRRSTWRLPRQSSPSLPLGDLSLMGTNQASRDRSVWMEIDKMNTKLGWSLSQNDDVDFGNVSNRILKDLLTYHIRNCPISNGQLNAASLIVNYTLVLIEKELQNSSNGAPFRFIEFKGMGSVCKGMKISKCNQFDIAMVVQPTECIINNVLSHIVSEDIPSGNVLLTVKDLKSDKRHKPYTKRASVADSNIGMYLQPREVLMLCKEMIDQALQRLMASSKSVLDRFPFTIQTSANSGLQLVLDTRFLHGLGLGIPEIGIRLCPALPLVNSSLSMLPPLYAVPPWIVQEAKHKPSSTSSMRIFRDRTEGLDSDLLWNLSYCDLEASYLATFDQKLKIAGINGCHRICLKIIKALFTSGYKTSLLSRGEIQSYQLETILFFLLLESAPSNWMMDKLGDRFSDCVHFLRSALESMWLPSFFVHNPHLEKQMPALKLYPLLSGGRQDNLLANMKTELMEKIVHFMEERLQESGLKDCIKDEYSSDMWEYEFFIFG